LIFDALFRSYIDALFSVRTVCHWLKPDVLLTSGVHGELLEWQLNRLKRKGSGDFFSDGQEARVLHREHQRFLETKRIKIRPILLPK
jgi:hypothetical protein